MSFILRILFSGLMTFIPSQDGKELTVVLLNANHHHVSDGTELADHKPLLFARAGSCSGDCPTRDAAIAQFIYEEQSQSAAQDALEAAVTGGAAWQLAGSDLSIRKTSANAADLPPLTFVENARASSNGVPLAIPTTSTERTDFSWLADLKQICPNDCTVDPARVNAVGNRRRASAPQERQRLYVFDRAGRQQCYTGPFSASGWNRQPVAVFAGSRVVDGRRYRSDRRQHRDRRHEIQWRSGPLNDTDAG